MFQQIELRSCSWAFAEIFPGGGGKSTFSLSFSGFGDATQMDVGCTKRKCSVLR